MTKSILTLVATLAITLPNAQAEESNSDYYSTQSHNKLILVQHHKQNFGKSGLRAYHDGFQPTGMDMKGWKLNQRETQAKLNAWCEERTEEMQEIRDRRDQVGEADMTVAAIEERCSQVYIVDISSDLGHVNDERQWVSGRCESVVNNNTGDRGVSCNVRSEVRLKKLSAQVRDGEVAFSVDDEWLGEGEHMVKVRGVGSAAIDEETSSSEADELARQSAAEDAGARIERKLLKVKEFRQRAPIVGVDKRVKSCLGQDQTYMDMPFRVLVNTPKGEKRKGFVKMRKVSDGCTMTSRLKQRVADGEDVKIEAAEAQSIIGGRAIQQGMTLERLPDRGLNVIVGGGAASTAYGLGGGAGVAFEYNLAKQTKISELHGVVGLDMPMNDGSFEAYIGARKRGYVGRFFADAGVNVGYRKSEEGSAVGGTPNVGLGMQLSPRLGLRSNLGLDLMFGDIGTVGPDLQLQFIYTL